MKKINICLTALLLSFFVATGAQALSLQSLIDGGSITAGDKLFADWRLIVDPTPIGQNVALPDYSEIEVTALDDGGMNPGPGLQFDVNGQLSVTGDNSGLTSYLDLFFGFSVAVLDPDKLIDDVSLNIGEWSIVNSGANGVYINEQVGIDAASVANPDNSLSLANTNAGIEWLDTEAISNLSGSANFAPQRKIYVSKNILVWASSPGETASLDQFSQRFSQVSVPEPHLVLLMAVGLMGFTFSVKRRKSLHGG